MMYKVEEFHIPLENCRGASRPFLSACYCGEGARGRVCITV
jgi:hypothetical protein